MNRPTLNPEEAKLLKDHPWIVWSLFEGVFRCKACGVTMPDNTNVAVFITDHVVRGKK